MIPLENYLIAVPFDYTEHHRHFKEDMLNTFFDFIKMPDRKGYNTCYKNESWLNPIWDAFINVIHREFDVDENIKEKTAHVYCQNNELFSSVWHNHAETSVINAVCYIDTPKEGGGLEVEYHGIHTINVQEGVLYLFPGWLMHRPMPQESTEWRVCINLEYECKQIPICRSTRMRW